MMDKLFERPVISLLLLAVLSWYLFVFQSGIFALTDPDETFYAQTAKEMFQKGEWLTPYLYGNPQFEKPILFYWLVELSFKVFGVNEFAARFPSAIFGFLGLVVLYFLGAILFNKRTGFLAALAIATSVEYVMLARACVTDMVLSTFMLLGVTFFFYGAIRKKDYFYLLSAVAFAFATLTKGPIGVLLPAVIIVAYLVIIKDFTLFRRYTLILACLAIFFAIALPWYLAMYKLHGKDFIDVFFGFHNVTRFLTPEHKTGSQFYYNIPIVFGGFFPWSAFLIFGFWHFGTKVFSRDSKWKNPSIFVLLWFLTIFVFFSVSSTKLPTYIFPSFVSLALIIGKLWDDFLSDSNNAFVRRGLQYSYYLLLIMVAGIAIGAHIFLALDYPTLVVKTLISAFFLILGMAFSLIAFIGKDYRLTFLLIAYSIIVFVYPLNNLILPEVEQYETSKTVSQHLLLYANSGDRIGCEKDYRPGVAFYTGQIPFNHLEQHVKAVEFLSSPQRVWCVLKEKNAIELYSPSQKKDAAKVGYLVYKFGEKCILTNKIPAPTGSAQTGKTR